MEYYWWIIIILAIILFAFGILAIFRKVRKNQTKQFNETNQEYFLKNEDEKQNTNMSMIILHNQNQEERDKRQNTESVIPLQQNKDPYSSLNPIAQSILQNNQNNQYLGNQNLVQQSLFNNNSKESQNQEYIQSVEKLNNQEKQQESNGENQKQGNPIINVNEEKYNNFRKSPEPPKPVIEGIIILQSIIDQTSKKRQVADEYKYYIRKYQDKYELKKHYSLKFQANATLQKYCDGFREVRGDGNCFYTAFGYQFISILLFDYSFDQFQEFINRIRQNELSMKIFVNGKNLKIDDKELERQLLEEFLYRLIKLKEIEDENQRQDSFNTQFEAYEKQSEEIDGYLYPLSTLFFRNYSNYVVDLSDKKDLIFDRENLLIWEIECDSNEIVIAELAKQLNLFVQLIFIENTENVVVRQHGNLENNKIILLIKPGHYNIGYYRK